MPNLSKVEFHQLILSLPKTILSKTGSASYSEFKTNGKLLSFKRVNTGEKWKLNLDELYEAYKNLNHINTIKIKKYISGRVYSPACAILISVGLYSSNGEKL